MSTCAKAVAHAMNYEAMVLAQDVKITILPGPTPANFVGYVDGLDFPTFDLDKAREYLAMTPWPDGGITLDYVYVTEFPREEIPGLILLEGLAELNIELNMVPMLWPDMTASCSSPETGPDIINIYTLPPFLDPDAHLYNQYHSDQWGSFNSCSFYQNDRVNELLDAQLVSLAMLNSVRRCTPKRKERSPPNSHRSGCTRRTVALRSISVSRVSSTRRCTR